VDTLSEEKINTTFPIIVRFTKNQIGYFT